jgi:BirA family biotin operon repressor/biotin-[acetyl-CoA-carboxylase] ligase
LKELTREAVENLESPLARTVELHDELGSTQERARELARGGASHGTLVISRVQTGGRGRLGRRWGSPPGGLWMSLLLRPDFEASIASRITQTAAVAVAKALRELGIEARIKWPNDLLVEGRKICGILAESSVGNAPVASKSVRPDASSRKLDHVTLGIGMNVNLDPEDLAIPDREVTTVRSELGRDVNLAEILKILLQNLETELNRIEDFKAVLGDWRALNCTLGQKVRIQRFGETIEGTAVELNPEGALILDTENGSIELFEGEIEHLQM